MGDMKFADYLLLHRIILQTGCILMLHILMSGPCAQAPCVIPATFNGALHTGPWIRIRCGLRIWIQRPLCLHTALIRIRAACRTVRKIQSSSEQCNARSLRAVWSLREITLNMLNPNRGSVSSESDFSALVENPTLVKITTSTCDVCPLS